MFNNNRENENRQELKLDSIVSAQPNIGPNIPDGGFGWIIVIGVAFFQVIFIVYVSIEITHFVFAFS